MKYSVTFSPEALTQLDALEDYISNTGSPLVAARFVDSLLDSCENLALFPLRGARRDDVLPGLRITPYRHSTVIAFKVDAHALTVSILGIFYGGQDYAVLSQQEGPTAD